MRSVAIVRVAALPVLYLSEGLVGHPELESDLFDPIFATGVIYALVVLWASLTARRLGSRELRLALDLLFITALTYVSGGHSSELRGTFFIVPLAAAFLLRPRLAAAAASLAVACYLVAALPPPPVGPRADAISILSFSLLLALMGVAATIFSHALDQRSQHILRLLREVRGLADSRRRHVAAALDSEERARRRIAEELHAGAVQDLIAAWQDLGDAQRGDHASLTRGRRTIERTIQQLRDEIFDLYPPILEHAGIAATLNVVAQREARRGGYRPRVNVDPHAAGIDDRLVLSLTRELLNNAAKHAHASHVAVHLECGGERLILTVTDDGIGFNQHRREAALRAGHIGLASLHERIEALEGTVTIHSAPNQGTRIQCTLPVSLAQGSFASSSEPTMTPGEDAVERLRDVA